MATESMGSMSGTKTDSLLYPEPKSHKVADGCCCTKERMKNIAAVALLFLGAAFIALAFGVGFKVVIALKIAAYVVAIATAKQAVVTAVVLGALGIVSVASGVLLLTRCKAKTHSSFTKLDLNPTPKPKEEILLDTPKTAEAKKAAADKAALEKEAADKAEADKTSSETVNKSKQALDLQLAATAADAAAKAAADAVTAKQAEVAQIKKDKGSASAEAKAAEEQLPALQKISQDAAVAAVKARAAADAVKGDLPPPPPPPKD
jgi:hypothetical protein